MESQTHLKKALITGITGQDGSYLAEFLLSKGYEVHGIIRRASTFNTGRIDHIYMDPHDPNARLFLHFGDLSDAEQINNLVYNIKPDEIYHLGAQSHVRVSFDIPEYTGNVTALSTVRLLEAIRRSGHGIKFYQASCYDEVMRVLTKEGIKKYSEIKKGDLLYTINEKTNKIELKPIKRIIIKDYKGEMIHFKNRRIDLMVTPNHRMLLQKDNNLFYEEASRVRNLISYKGTSDISLPSPSWKGKYKKNIVFSTHINLAGMHYNNFKNLIKKMDMKDYLYLLGIYIGDGYTAPKRKQERYSSAKEYIKIKDEKGKFTKREGKKEEIIYESNNIYFALPEKDKARSKVIKILKKYFIDYKLSSEWVRFSSYPMARVFKESGENVYNKRIPSWVLELSSGLLERLFEGLIDSDGSRRKIKNERQTYTTVSRKLAEDFIVLCLKVGKIPKINFCLPNKVYFEKEKRFLNSKECYRINIAYKKARKIYNTNIFRKKYDGKIWCLEVKDNHNFLVERNGFIAFSGNSSEMFGAAKAPQSENTPFQPQSPYASAKAYAYWMVKNYRDGYGLFACNGILFNHESPRRGETFVTRKITRGLANILAGRQKKLYLGYLDAKRDWGFAPEYVEAMWLMLQQDKPDDYVVGTGESHSVREFIEKTFSYAGINISWRGKDINTKGIIDSLDSKLRVPPFLKKGYAVIEIDRRYFRPNEVDCLRADITKAKKHLNWLPKVKFEELVKIMVDHDLRRAGIDPPDEGASICRQKRFSYINHDFCAKP